MKINRIIMPGVKLEIELTPTELCQAYREWQHILDKEAMEDLYLFYSPKEIEEEWHVTRDELDAGLDEMADALRKNIDKYDRPWDAARDKAFNDFIAKHARA